MKHVLFIFFLVTICSSAFSQKSRFLKDDNSKERILYLKDSTPYIISNERKSCGQETNYVSHNISNVGIRESQNSIYISWEVCDDVTNSVFYIIKTKEGDNQTKFEFIKNVPSNINVPILYCYKDYEFQPGFNYFYTLFKELEGGELVHITTMVVPSKKETSENNYLDYTKQKNGTRQH